MLYEELIKNGKILPGISDIVFKKIMINHKDYLGLILENCTPLRKEDVIENGRFLKIEIPPSHLKLKNMRMDLLLKVNNYYINLEANSVINTGLIIRNQAHFAGMIYNEYARRGKKTLDEILYQVSFNKTSRYVNNIKVNLQLWDKELNVGEDNIFKCELNLAYVSQKYYNKEKLNKFEKALMVLILEDEKELLEFVKGDNMLEDVGNEIISYSRAKEIVTAYENAMIEETYHENVAREEGHAEGQKERNIEIARNLLTLNNISIEDISKTTGLSIDEIKKLKENN